MSFCCCKKSSRTPFSNIRFLVNRSFVCEMTEGGFVSPGLERVAFAVLVVVLSLSSDEVMQRRRRRRHIRCHSFLLESDLIYLSFSLVVLCLEQPKTRSYFKGHNFCERCSCDEHAFRRGAECIMGAKEDTCFRDNCIELFPLGDVLTNLPPHAEVRGCKFDFMCWCHYYRCFGA